MCDDVCAFTRETECKGAADSSGCAGDGGDFSFEETRAEGGWGRGGGKRARRGVGVVGELVGGLWVVVVWGAGVVRVVLAGGVGRVPAGDLVFARVSGVAVS